MKLGELKNKIRHSKGAPKVITRGPNGEPAEVIAQKASVLTMLDELFGGGRTTETGMMFTDEGVLVPEGVKANVGTNSAVHHDQIDDLDALDEIDELGEIGSLDETDELDEIDEL